MGEMRETTDVELLRDYAEHGHEAAFRALVTRYTDLVYSAALRQLESADLAGDITQSVFLDLARKARSVSERLAAHNSLAGWLHRSTRYAVLNHLRDTRRRVTNERQAMEQLLHNSDASVDWEQIRPALDEALDSLGDEDREALLLRYFKNQDLRTVGAVLGVSDDAAQKRVGRAVERLREFFAKRGVSIGAGGLVAVVSANAVQAAPVGLALTISAAAVSGGTAVATAATATATNAIAMTTLQKTVIGATLAVAVGTGIYEARQASQLRDQVQILQQQQAPLADRLKQLENEREESASQIASLRSDNERLSRNTVELLKLRGEIARLRLSSQELSQLGPVGFTNANDPLKSAMEMWLARVNQLKQRLEAMPDKKIPEFQFLSPEEWLEHGHGFFENDQGTNIRRVLADLRISAKRTFANLAGHALDEYIIANNGALPDDISQLKPYFALPVSEAILDRYKIVQTGRLAALSSNQVIIAEKSPVDDREDTLFTISAYGWTWKGTGLLTVGTSSGSWDTSRIKEFMKQSR